MEIDEKEIFDLKNYTDTRSSMYIEASAGTGKTYTITGIVSKLLSQDLPLDKILIVTYTEKAVGELRDRIRKACPDADVDNASIYTIHSFCQRVLSEYSFTANQSQSLSVIDDTALDDFLERQLRDKKKDFQVLIENAASPSYEVEKIKAILKAAINKYYLNSIYEEDPDIISLDQTYWTKKDTSFTYADCEKLLQDNENNPDFFLNKFDTPFGGKKLNNVEARINAYKEAVLYRELLRTLYKDWLNEKSKNKVQSYNDMLRNVREAVCDKSSDLKEKLCNLYTYAIIDEFQDTNQIQWDIFKNVFLDSPDHTLIVVGDPKQSIYSFQGADVNVYQKAVNAIKGQGGKAYKLTTNYRSTNAMVNACNTLFSSKKDISEDEKFFKDFPDSSPSGKIENATYTVNGKTEEIKPFWIACEKNKTSINESNFANAAVEAIINCCTYENGKSRLQVYDKDLKKHRNVSFRDFAILARTAVSELPVIEAALQQAGIPFLRYKDKNLFNGRECKNWISLLKAISAEDFTGYNRTILSEALFTDFFRVELKDLLNEKYDDPLCPEREKIIQWQLFSKQRKWAKLIERVFSDTNIESELSKLDKLQSLSKYRQIGNYIVDYLYKSDSSLEDTAKRLERLSSSTDSDSDNGLVEKGTDFDCVQLLTIHSSKGLQFPVVIAQGGFIGQNKRQTTAYSFHAENDKSYLSLLQADSKAEYNPKKIMLNEQLEEFRRLYYVAYTRAESLLILPNYEFADGFSFLKTNINSLLQDESQQFYKVIENDADKSFEDLQKEVQQILFEQRKEKEALGSQEENLQASEKQKEKTGQLSKIIPGLVINKHSYVTLTHNRQNESEMTSDGERLDKEGSTQENLILSKIDTSANPASQPDLQTSSAPASASLPAAPVNFPRGKRLGIALHEVFEKADFEKYGQLQTAGQAQTDESLLRLISECFERQTYLITPEDPDKWLVYTAEILWNTLNAKLPEIQGSRATQKHFSLNQINAANRISEAEFNINADLSADGEKLLKNYCKGFIDLVFAHEADGHTVYSILDWKSDTLDAHDYSDSRSLESHTNSHYSIQRVLYSYSLVKWLASFHQNESLEEVYKNYFGGIYYVYIRGCEAGSGSGIYARTWTSWAELEKAFNTIFEPYRRNK